MSTLLLRSALPTELPSPVRFNNAQIAGDACRGKRMVTGNHDGADAGAMRFGDGIAHFGTRRIDDADHADPDQVAFPCTSLWSAMSAHVTGGVDAHARHMRRATRCRAGRYAWPSVRYASADRRSTAARICWRSPCVIGRTAPLTAMRAAVAEQHVGGTLWRRR